MINPHNPLHVLHSHTPTSYSVCVIMGQPGNFEWFSHPKRLEHLASGKQPRN